MGYKSTHLLFLFRKLSRSESRKGSLRLMLGAFFVSLLIVVGARFIPESLDQTLLLKNLFSLRGEINPPDELVLVQIDDESYNKLSLSPRRPFPREVSAKAIKSIQKDKPALLVLDLFFPLEEDEVEGTRLFKEALEMGPSVIASAPIISDNESDEDSLYVSDPEIRQAAEYELPMTVNSVYGLTLYMNRYLADFNKRSQDELTPLFRPLKEKVKQDIFAPEQRDLINYYGPSGTIRNFSIWEFFADERIIPKDFFKDKIVFVGFKSDLKERGHSDKELLGVPVKPSGGKFRYEMYGVEIHATIAGNLLEGSWLKRLPISVESSVLFLLIFFLIYGIITLTPLSALIYLVSFLGVWFLGTFVLFSYFNIFFPGVYLALLCAPIIFGAASCWVATLALKELREMKRTFGVDK